MLENTKHVPSTPSYGLAFRRLTENILSAEIGLGHISSFHALFPCYVLVGQ